MKHRIVTSPISANNLVEVRDRTRTVGALFGLDKLDNTRFITAVSELARNVVQHAGEGKVTFLLDDGSDGGDQSVLAELSDQGPGIADVQGALAGRINGQRVTGKGLASSKRLADQFSIE